MCKWKKIKLKEVLTEISERNKNENIKKVLSVTNSQGFIVQEDYFEGTVHSENISNYKIIRKKQFAYNPSRVNVGSIDILEEYEYGVLSPMYIVFEVDKTKLLPEYFKYYFQTHEFFENVKNNTQGSVRHSLSFKALANFEYLLPTIEEQEKIVKLLKNLDCIINKYEKLLEEKNQFIKSQFVKMFGDVINNTKNFAYKPIGQISEIVTGTTPSTSNMENWNGNICWITPAELDNNSIYIFDTERKITKIGQKSKSLRLMPKGTVLFTTRAPIGKVAITNNEMCCNQGFKNCICKQELNNLYLYYTLKNNTYYFNKLGAGSTFRELSKSIFEKVKISVPPIELQNKFASFVELINKQQIMLEQQKKNYEKLKKGLMQQLLTGKVRVKI